MKIAELHISRTSETFASYRLYERQDNLTAPERRVWNNRVYPLTPADGGARLHRRSGTGTGSSNERR